MKNESPYEPSVNDWNRYLHGEMNDAERASFESFIENDPFAKEALEGFSTDPGSIHFFEERVAASYPVMGSSWKLRLLQLFFATALMTGMAVLVYTLTNKEEKKEVSEKIESLPEPAVSDEVVAVLDSELRVIDHFEPLAKEDQIRYTPSKKAKESPLIQMPAKTEVVEEMNIPDPPIKKEIVVEEPDRNLQVKHKAMPLLSFHDHKVIDYSQTYTAPIEKRTWVLTGVPASKENANSRELETDLRTEHIPYNEYLRESMRLFGAHRYRDALKRYKVILAQYPEDLNAYFYGALSYYNLGKYDAAMLYLEHCIVNEIDEYKPEAEWCKTQVLLKTGRKKEAVQLLERIVDEKGFYAEQAKNKLSNIRL